MVATGSSKLKWKLSAILSAPILEAEYGDCPWSGCSSSIGTVRAVPVGFAGRGVDDKAGAVVTGGL